jgi:hypothetical protein
VLDARSFVFVKDISPNPALTITPFASHFTEMLNLGLGHKYFVFSEDDMHNPYQVQFVTEKPLLESVSSLIVGEADWEGTFSNYPNAIYDEELKKYFIYYRCFTRKVDYANEHSELYFSNFQ